MYSRSHYFTMQFGADATPTDTQFLLPGFGADVADEPFVAIPIACALAEIQVYCVTAPGGVVVDTYTVRKNGASLSGAAATVTGAVQTGSTSLTPSSYTFADGDTVGILFGTSGATAADDVSVTLLFLIDM